MQTERYYIKSFNTDFKAVISYTDNRLSSLVFENATDAQIRYLCNIIAQDSSIEHINSVERLKVQKAQEDLSFAAFWTAFRYKVGKKARAERLWNALSDTERQAVFACIPSYHRFIANKNQNSAYPETWLNNKMWECDYRIGI